MTLLKVLLLAIAVKSLDLKYPPSRGRNYGITVHTVYYAVVSVAFEFKAL